MMIYEYSGEIHSNIAMKKMQALNFTVDFNAIKTN